MPQSESRARFEEAWEIIRRAWTEEVFSFEGRFWSYETWRSGRGPVQQPHPPVWVPVTAAKRRSSGPAAQHPDHAGRGPTRGLREDVIRYYARCLAQHGHRITPDHLIIQASVYVADTKEQAVDEAGPYALYFNRTLFSHGNITERDLQRQPATSSAGSHDYLRPEHVRRVLGQSRALPRHDAWRASARGRAAAVGHAGRVRRAHHRRRRPRRREHVLVSLNRGAMPHEMFMEQIRRFASDVLPALHAHRV